MLLDWTEVEVGLDVLLPLVVALGTAAVSWEPCSRVKEVVDVDEPNTVEPLAMAMVVAAYAVSPLRFPEERVVVDDRLR